MFYEDWKFIITVIVLTTKFCNCEVKTLYVCQQPFDIALINEVLVNFYNFRSVVVVIYK